MKKETKWIIVDVSTEMALYGLGKKTLTFSSRDVAIEVASQFFENDKKYIVLQINN